MPASGTRARRPDVAGALAAVVAAGGLVFAAWALALVVVEDDAPAPRTLSADEAAASGAPIVELGEMFVRGDLEVEAGRPVVVVNRGVAPHNLAVEGGPVTPVLAGGQAVELDVTGLSPGSYTVFCTIEGHRAGGMEAQLVVGG